VLVRTTVVRVRGRRNRRRLHRSSSWGHPSNNLQRLIGCGWRGGDGNQRLTSLEWAGRLEWDGRGDDELELDDGHRYDRRSVVDHPGRRRLDELNLYGSHCNDDDGD